MGDKTAIEWTDATWNPIRARNLKTGRVGWFCIHMSEGCANCYAEDWNMRLGTGLPYKPGHLKDIEIFLDEKTLEQPLRWRAPRKIFPCPMTDMFADFVKDEWIRRMVMVMADARQHTFQPLTKRPGRAMAAFSQLPAPLNVWLGVSVEDQATADERIPVLLATRADGFEDFAAMLDFWEQTHGPILFEGAHIIWRETPANVIEVPIPCIKRPENA